MYLIMKGENKQTVYVKEIQRNRVRRAEKQKTGIEEEKSESVPVFLLEKAELTLSLYKASRSYIESLSPSVIPYPYLKKRRNHPWHYC